MFLDRRVYEEGDVNEQPDSPLLRKRDRKYFGENMQLVNSD